MAKTASGIPSNNGVNSVTPKGGVQKGPAKKGTQTLTGAGKSNGVGNYNVNPSAGNGAPVTGGAGSLTKGPKKTGVGKKFSAQNTFNKF